MQEIFQGLVCVLGMGGRGSREKQNLTPLKGMNSVLAKMHGFHILCSVVVVGGWWGGCISGFPQHTGMD